jgi:hypothetical protein
MPQDVLINFDDLPVGTAVTNQYHDKGVDFFGPPNGGLLPVITQVPPGEAHSGNQVANISTCLGCEFFTPFATGRFTNTVEHISMYVGQFDGQPDTAQLTLSAFDAGHNLLAQSPPVTVTAGGGFNTLLSVEVAAGNIASFEVSARTNLDVDKQLGIDDLTFGSTQVLPPDFGLVPTASAVLLAPGSSTPDTISVIRVNGSMGSIQFMASGLPQGVTAAFAPDPAGGDSTTLTFTAIPNAPLTGANFVTVTITATPLSPNAGSVVHTAQVGVSVRPNFTLGVKGSAQITLAPCSTTTVTLTVAREVTFQTEQIDLSVTGLPPGVQATLDPSSVGAPSDGGFVNVVTLILTDVTYQQITPESVTVEATSGSQTSTLTLFVQGLAGSIDSFEPTSGLTPQSGRQGTEVVLQGVGFCQESQVAFGLSTLTGQPIAKAKPTSISADGRELHVNVPDLATDGPLAVITPSGHQIISTDVFRVQSYRNTDGFSFENYPYGGINFDDTVELFGFAQTHLFGTPIPNPLVGIFIVVFNAFFGGHESCYGFCLASQRLLHGDQSFSPFPPSGATTVWRLQGPIAPSAQLAHYIHIQHIAQLSAENVHFYLARSVGNIGASGDDIRSQVVSLLASGDHPIIALRKSSSEGHVLIAYDLEEGDGEGDFYIDVYDPNIPFVGEENVNGELHKTLEQASHIHVFPDGRWHYPLYKHDCNCPHNWDGDASGLIVIPYGVPPVQPTIPTSLDGLTTVISGDGTHTTQIADAQGHTLLRPDGTLNTDPATRLPQATPFAPLDITGPASEMYLLGGAGPYTHTVKSTSSGGYRYTLLSPGFAARVENAAASPGVDDELLLHPQSLSLQFRTDEASRAITVDLLVQVNDGDVRIATITTTSFKGTRDGFAFDQPQQPLTYTHSGAATDYTVVFEGTNAQHQRVKFFTPSLHIEPNDTAMFSQADWHHLGRTTVTLTVTHRDGTRSVRTLKNDKPDPDDDNDDHHDQHDA